MKIDPSKATLQSPRELRVGSKGRARALAAAAEGKAPPDEAEDDDEDDEEEEQESKEPTGEADSAALASCADACEAAAEACTGAAEQLTAQAAELRAGTDSISSLQATEAACATADEALDEASSACASLRGAEPPADVEDAAPPPMAPAPSARAIAKASPAATVEEHLQTARLAAFGLHVLGRLGLTAADTVKAKGVLGARLDAAAERDTAKKSEAKAKAKGDVARREKLWEDAVRDRRVQLPQAFARVDGPDGKPVRVYAKWAAEQNAAYPEIEAFEAWITSRVPEPGTKSVEPTTALADLAAEKRAAFTLTERDKLEAKRAGVDPDALARQLATQQRGAQGTAERV